MSSQVSSVASAARTPSPSAAAAYSAALETIAAAEPDVAAAIVGELAVDIAYRSVEQLQLLTGANSAEAGARLAREAADEFTA